MPATRFGPGGFLEYNSKHSVLICRECHYAIQKSALTSHLLRHKIYREERRHLLSIISELNILEPDQVSLPVVGSPPIDSLPVVSGYRCTAEGCGSLYASSKRMSLHFNETHNKLLNASETSSRASSIQLQTFFRGTKVKYFEVSSSPVHEAVLAEGPNVAVIANVNRQGASLSGETSAMESEERFFDVPGELHDRLNPISARSRSVSSPNEIHSESSSLGIDLNTLAYFNHFTATTLWTLPPGTHGCEQDWRLEIVAQALENRWLMHGVLAISACHLSSLEEGDTEMKTVHRGRFTQLCSQFYATWDEIARDKSPVDVQAAVPRIMGAGWRLSCILRCAQWSLEGQGLCRTTTTDTTPPGALNYPMTILRSFLLTNAEPSHGSGELRFNRRDDSSKAYVVVVDAQRSTGAGSLSTPSGLNTPPPAVLSQLRAIPFRLAVLCDRPKCVEDGTATLAAAATLDDCCHDCFASDDGAWQGMLSWLEKVPDHFHTMVLHQAPAALLVLAYWVAVLVNRVEQQGYWFLGGGAKRLLMLIGDALPPTASKVKSLVLNLTE